MEFCIILAVISTVFMVVAAAPLSRQDHFEDVGEYGYYFEGDMVLTNAQHQAIDAAMVPREEKDPEQRNGLLNSTYRWPDDTVVYDIDEEFDFDENEINMFEKALEDISEHSCVRFRKRENKEEYAVILQGLPTGCFSNVGFKAENDSESDGYQVLNLAKTCFRHGTIIHEMLHTLGFYHMQSTYDRDDFVTIIWKNIKPGTEHNFEKYNNDTVTDFGVPYDYDSLMHYSTKAFSINGENTIVPKKEGVEVGQRKGLSESDILKLNKMYKCSEKVVQVTESTEKETRGRVQGKTGIGLNLFNIANKT